jgi:hypothetical protein
LCLELLLGFKFPSGQIGAGDELGFTHISEVFTGTHDLYIRLSGATGATSSQHLTRFEVTDLFGDGPVIIRFP